ncbi:MAG: hypothetical protein AB7N73_13135 [Gemmatimonadales bacterium]|nr:hypothetical protein [Gemmatimonadales bacterium]HRX17753.1 hypothetical protein [Gemmatimonadales bacterium]
MLHRTGWLVTLASVLACGPNLAQEPADAFAARVDSAITRSDTARLATLAAQRCTAGDKAERQTCLEDYFLALAGEGRVTLALGALERLGTAEEDVAKDGHGYTHVIGIKAWQPGDDVAEVFRSCTSLYQSGCYHGVIQSYLTASGTVDSARVLALCDEIAPQGTDNWLRFQCMHGLGHGLEMAWNWDLPRALGGCDWLSTAWDRDSCYGGAIMENAVASSPGGHHTAKRALEQTGDDHGMHMDHGDHATGADMGGTPFKMRDSTDALYPCSVLDARYQRACYLGHGGILLATVDYDFERAAAACDATPTEVRDVCYTSLGTNASGATVMDAARSIKLCSPGDPAWRKWCFVGVVKNFIDVTADPASGIAFCRDVPEGVDRDACWNAVGEQLSVLYTTDLDRRSAVCETTGEGEARCRQGAGLWPKIPPEALPAGG